METIKDMVTLAKMLEVEFHTGDIDHGKAKLLADKLLPHHPELHSTLNSVRNRMSRALN